MRADTHKEFIERWVDFIKDKPLNEWKPKFNEFINAQFEKAKKVRQQMEKTDEGREIKGYYRVEKKR